MFCASESPEKRHSNLTLKHQILFKFIPRSRQSHKQRRKTRLVESESSQTYSIKVSIFNRLYFVKPLFNYIVINTALISRRLSRFDSRPRFDSLQVWMVFFMNSDKPIVSDTFLSCMKTVFMTSGTIYKQTARIYCLSLLNSWLHGQICIAFLRKYLCHL